MIQPKRICFSEYGEPLNSVHLQTFFAPRAEAGEVLIRLLASPIHPSDFGVIAGSYGRLPETLPAVGGREGVGVIIGLGDGVDVDLLGKMVAMPEGAVWQQAAVEQVERLYVLPDDVPVDMAAMGFINPATAWRLLHDFVALKKGDWIIQNAGNSAVGHCVIQLAAHLGYRTLSVVRDKRWIEPLKSIGATEVVLEGDDYVKSLHGGIEPKLALNSLGGQSAIKLIKMLADGGIHVTFGGMTVEPVRFPTRDLIFRGVKLHGFWLDNWLRNAEFDAYKSMYDTLFDLIKKEVVNIPVEKKYPLEEYKEAFAHAQKESRIGKILFQSHWWPNNKDV